MKTRVLARTIHENDKWVAQAYQQEGVFCSASGITEAQALEHLKNEVGEILATSGQAWLKRWRGAAGTPNCPEGTVELLIDVWVCKLKNETCPIQAQVSLEEPNIFFQHCLAESDRKQQIFDAVTKQKYRGFHHLPGRYLCVGCENEGKAINFRYHYPWELTQLSAYYPFSVECDWPQIRLKLICSGPSGKSSSLSAISTALCAKHCKSLAEQLEPSLAAQLRTLEFDITR